MVTNVLSLSISGQVKARLAYHEAELLIEPRWLLDFTGLEDSTALETAPQAAGCVP